MLANIRWKLHKATFYTTRSSQIVFRMLETTDHSCKFHCLLSPVALKKVVALPLSNC